MCRGPTPTNPRYRWVPPLRCHGHPSLGSQGQPPGISWLLPEIPGQPHGIPWLQTCWPARPTWPSRWLASAVGWRWPSWPSCWPTRLVGHPVGSASPPAGSASLAGLLAGSASSAGLAALLAGSARVAVRPQVDVPGSSWRGARMVATKCATMAPLSAHGAKSSRITDDMERAKKRSRHALRPQSLPQISP